MTAGGTADPLLGVLARAQRRGFLGPAPVEEQIGHARALARFAGTPAGPVLDLGSGGGLPGLVLAETWSTTPIALLDAQQRRVEHLRHAVSELAIGHRVEVLQGRAEVLARDPERRGRYGLLVARAFGPPAVTAECAVGFLRAGGSLIVSDAPDPTGRWPEAGLARLGLTLTRREQAEGASFVELRRSQAAASEWPRRDGMPAKRPLW